MAAPTTLTPELLVERIAEADRTGKLNIGYMGLTSIPQDVIAQIVAEAPHIQELELSSNQLTDLPEEIAQLRYVRKLHMKYNKLTHLPQVLDRFPRLQVLELSGNQIEVIDESVQDLKQVRDFDLSGNMLKKLPAELCRMPALSILQLENNRLESIPENMDELQTLVRLDVSTNALTHLPTSMGKLKKIQRLDAANNQLMKVPPCMGHCKTLKEFNLKYNDLAEPYRVKADEGLVRFLAFLREEEERERLEEIERLKPIGTDVGKYTEYRCKADSSQIVKLEDGESVAIDNRCWMRSGHTLTQVGNYLYMFGGMITKDGTKSNELFWLSTDRMEWHNQLTTGTKPCPRDGHTVSFDELNNRLVVFGGRSQEKKRLNDVHCLSLDTWEWTRPNCDGNTPAPREQSMSFILDGIFYVFGGHGSGARFNDLHILDLSVWVWSTPTTTGTPPSPRQNSAVCLYGLQLFLHGGRNNAVLDDLFVYDLNERVWTEIVIDQTRAPPARHGHILCVFKDHLMFFGGQGTLGGAATNMFRLAIPDRASLLTARPEWKEMDSEMPFNKCRTYTFHRDQLSCFQLGSQALGITVSEDADRGLGHWDVFRYCELAVVEEKPMDEEALKPKNAKNERVKHTMMNLSTAVPRRYTTQSPKEQRIIDYVDDFQRTFSEIYPQRRPLIMVPPNECGVRKFACTTVRPTMLAYSELYDMRSCARFVADFIGYEELEDPLHYPKYLPCSMSVLNWQAGDSFDLSLLLCSLLIGVGYDAYVVVGYAPKPVTTNDQSQTICPVLESEQQEEEEARKRESNQKVEEKQQKYTVRKAIILESQFEKQLKDEQIAERKVKAEEARKRESNQKVEEKQQKYAVRKAIILESQFEKQLKDEQIAERKVKAEETRKLEEEEPDMTMTMGGLDEADEMENKRVHSWVLVRAGKREVADHVFVEPSTGRVYPTGSSPYISIEQMWNDVNLWVNMQLAEPHSDTRKPVKEISFDLQDASKWEYVLEDVEAPPGGVAPSKDEASLTGADKSASKAGELTKAPTMQKGKPGKDKKDDEGHEQEEEGKKDNIVGTCDDMPASWVPKLYIARDKLDTRCPKGNKNTLYSRCQHELFALFGECSRWDGMVERLTIYGDDERTEVLECREKYARRKDKLRERRTYPTADITKEFFDPGSSNGLKDMTLTKGTRREVNFYHKSRLDGLSHRIEIMKQKTMEYFIGRDDRLEYRSVTYLPQPEVNPDEEPTPAKGRRRGRKAREEPQQPIGKMTCKYARNDQIDAEADVFKKTFYVAEERIRIIYHYHKSRITRSQRIYTNDNAHALRHITQVDPLARKPKDSQLLEEYQRLVAEERECQQAVRDSEREWKVTTQERTKEEQNISLLTPYYDIVRAKTEESDEEEMEEVKAQYDFLQPFMPVVIGTRSLTREEALEVREKCLKALKDRLIERANIIQARHEEETASLAKRQTNFQRDRDQMSREDEEDYERQCEESMFRIHILEQRLKRHEEQALQKYYELDSKLRNDNRLSILTSGE